VRWGDARNLEHGVAMIRNSGIGRGRFDWNIHLVVEQEHQGAKLL